MAGQRVPQGLSAAGYGRAVLLARLNGFLLRQPFDVHEAPHRRVIHLEPSLERLKGEIKQRSDAVGIFPNEAASTRLTGALLLEQNDGQAVQPAP